MLEHAELYTLKMAEYYEFFTKDNEHGTDFPLVLADGTSEQKSCCKYAQLLMGRIPAQL